MEKMLKNQMVQREFGKKKMVRESMPEVTKRSKKGKKQIKNPDIAYYFGEEIDLDKIPDRPKEEEQKQGEAGHEMSDFEY